MTVKQAVGCGKVWKFTKTVLGGAVKTVKFIKSKGIKVKNFECASRRNCLTPLLQVEV